MDHSSHHETAFVVASIVVAMLGSWTALDLQRQVKAHSGRIRLYWLAAASAAMGLSIFSMHFIAMLGFNIDGSPVSYNTELTVGSLLLAVASTSVAWIAVQSGSITWLRLGIAAFAMGAGICLMHYAGMAAMQSNFTLAYDWSMVGASFAIAVTASGVALWAALKSPGASLRVAGSFGLGLAVCSMHFTAMRAVSFQPSAFAGGPQDGLAPGTLAMVIGTGTIALLGLALISAMFDRRFEAMSLREAATVRMRKAQFREILSFMPIGVAMIQRDDGAVVFMNPLAEELFGSTSPFEFPLLDLEDNVLPASEHPVRRAMLAGERVDRQLVRAAREDGATSYLEFSTTISPEIEGEHAERVILMIQDVTARYEAEQALAQTQKLETIGHLTGGVAHDFNNLLTPIVGGLDMLSREPGLSPRAERVIDGATQAASRATTLVQRLLAFARRQNLTVKTVDMGELLYGIRDLISRSIGPRIKIAMDAEPGLVAQIDAAQFELAILNLAVNARDAMPDGGSLTIKASFHGLDQATGDGLQPGRYVKVCVSDTGQGMAPAVLARAVEPFFSTKGVGKGTGLGLSMVHGLAAQSNGVLRLSSAVGRGTTAELWLPLADEGAVGQTDQQDRNVPAGNGTILLVDDEELVRRATAEMLRDCGYVVVEAASGSEALNCLRKNPGLALLVTDQVMPGMLGSELACAARKIDPDLPVLVITGYAGTENLPPWVEGMHKPFRQDELARAVVRLARSTSSKIVDISQARHK